MLNKFLEMYYSSLTPEDNHHYNYESLEKGLETCLRAMGPNFDDNQLLFMVMFPIGNRHVTVALTRSAGC